MYGYRQQSNESALMTNLNSISSSLSSLDTIGRHPNATSNNNNNNNNINHVNNHHNGKANADNLITLRSHSIASNSLLWNKNNGTNNNEDRYSNKQQVYANTMRRGSHNNPGSEIYFHSGRTKLTSYCPMPETALNLTLVPLLLLTITRQVFDFMGQIWLQIIINFFTIILLIVALFGIKQHRIFYLSIYSLWALHNALWNLIVICIHSKIKDVGLTEDVLSFYTGATSWWHSNGPGCLPYNISSIQPSITILQPNIITGCRLDYHLIEAVQAALHALLSFLSSLFCCCIIASIHRNPTLYFKKNKPAPDKAYRLNNLMQDRAKINPDPSTNQVANSRFVSSNTASLRRAPNKTSSRSSQHSMSSMRSARRRNRLASTEGPTLPTPRGSTSSAQRSQKYGSLSSRRSSKARDRRSDIASLTYGTTGERPGANGQRTRLSSLSSVDYLPSYQPPHSSSANLLSSYGEISSIDSYNNNRHNHQASGHKTNKKRLTSVKSIDKGNTNPTYQGSRSSICSHNNNNNYDDLSYIYGNNNVNNSESLYGATSSAMQDTRQHRQQTYQQNTNSKNGTMSKRNGGFKSQEQPQKIQAETHQSDYNDKYMNGDAINRSKMGMTNGSFQTFAAQSNNHQYSNGINGNSKPQLNNNGNSRPVEINNNHLETSNYHGNLDLKNRNSNNQIANGNPNLTSFDMQRSHQNADNSTNFVQVNNNQQQQQQIYTQQRTMRHPIYSNHASQQDGNSETPI